MFFNLSFWGLLQDASYQDDDIFRRVLKVHFPRLHPGVVTPLGLQTTDIKWWKQFPGYFISCCCEIPQLCWISYANLSLHPPPCCKMSTRYLSNEAKDWTFIPWPMRQKKSDTFSKKHNTLEDQKLYNFWLVISSHLKNISQNGNLPQIGVKLKKIWNHHPVIAFSLRLLYDSTSDSGPESPCGQVQASQLWSQSSQAFVNFNFYNNNNNNNNNSSQDTLTTNPSSHPCWHPNTKVQVFLAAGLEETFKG